MSYALLCDVCGDPIDESNREGFVQFTINLLVPTVVDPASLDRGVQPRPGGRAQTRHTHRACAEGPTEALSKKRAPANP